MEWELGEDLALRVPERMASFILPSLLSNKEPREQKQKQTPLKAPPQLRLPNLSRLGWLVWWCSPIDANPIEAKGKKGGNIPIQANPGNSVATVA